MKNRLTAIFVALISIIFLMCPCFSQEFTLNYGANLIEKSVPLFKDDDKVIRGVFNDYTYWFILPKYAKVDDAVLSIELSHAKELLLDVSSLAISINDEPVGQFFLTPANSDHYKATFPVPKQNMKSGYNLLKFSFFMKSSTVPCMDVDSPVNWSVIHKSSFISFKYRVAEDPGIKYFDEIFCKVNNLAQEDVAFVLDDNPGDDMLTAASIIADYLGKSSGNPRKITALYKSAVTQADSNKYNMILFTTSSPNAGETGAFLSLSKSTQDKYAFTIASKTQEGVKKAALFLASNDMSSCDEASKIIPEELLSKTESKPRKTFPNKATFKYLGYPDTTASGAFSTNASFALTRPCNWLLRAASKADLVMIASELLVPYNSSVTVQINGIPVATRKFTGKTEQAFILSAYIPQNMLDMRDFTLQTNFYFDVGQKDCNHRFLEKAWAVVKDSSCFYLPHSFKIIKDFDDFPSMFMTGDRLAPTTLYVSDRPSQGALSAALSICAAAGFRLPGETSYIQIKKASSFAQAPKAENIALLGWPTDFDFYEKLEQYLPVKFDRQNNRFELEKKTSRVCPDKDYAVMQMAASIFARSKVICVFMAKDAGYDYLSEIFSGPGVYSLKGDFVFTHASDKIFSYNMALRQKKQAPGMLFIIIWLTGVAVFGAMSFFAYKILARKK